MKKLYVLTLISIILLSCKNEVINSDIYPTPQSIVEGERSMNTTRGFRIVGANSADDDAVRVLNRELNITDNGIPIIIGERGDDVIADYKQYIPRKAEGYYLYVNKRKIIVAGNDPTGTYYGVQTLLQLAKQQQIRETTIIDYPSIAQRGMIEGYYGNPLSYDDRVSQFEFYGKNKMNRYIYGPKNDPYHGFSNKWRDSYPEEKAAEIKSLINKAKQNKVQFVWAIHPGLNLKWNREDSLATLHKFQQMYDLGVRSFAVFFDDIPHEHYDAKRQAGYLNYIQREFIDKKNNTTSLIMCPSVYNQAWDKGDYLEVLGSVLLPEIEVMWTGKMVCSMIDRESMDYINTKIKRNAYIWLNYPVNDYVIDHLAMGPFVGNSNDIDDMINGFVANPMEYGEASKVALFSIANYTWNMKGYNAQKSWEESLQRIMPNNTAAFKVFCENNIDLGASYHNLRMPNESLPFVKDRDIYLDGAVVNIYNKENSDKLRAHFNTFIASANELKSSNYNPALIAEITPWLDVFEIVGKKGIILMDMQEQLSQGDTTNFISNYIRITELEAEQKSIISRDFEGSIKKPNPKAANEVVAPFLAELQRDMIEYYRKNYSYKSDIFPTNTIEEGKYHIKINGKYLHNTRGTNTPTLRKDIDKTNPPRVEWRVTIDPLTGFYKFTSEQDGRFLNSYFQLSDRDYNIAIHAMSVKKSGTKVTIRNSKIAGSNYYIVRGNIIAPRKGNEKTAPAQFEFVKI